MSRKRICITTDCTCDLPREYLKENAIDIVHFYIQTDRGVFKDVEEITAGNIFDYIRNGGSKTLTSAPPAQEFSEFFQRKLEEYDEVIHIAISGRISECVTNSTEALKLIGADGKRVHIFDSGHLSTGLGLLVMSATDMMKEGLSVQEIIHRLDAMKEKVSTTFMTYNADYLYRNGKVSKNVKSLSDIFKIHPVLKMKEGYIKLASIRMGSYERSILKYIRRELKNIDEIDKKQLFITHAGCSVSEVRMIRKAVERLATFENITCTTASATISGNCGPRTFGLLYVKK